MQTTKPPQPYGIGHQLVDSTLLSTTSIDVLFAALFIASISTLVGGNLLYLDAAVARQSSLVAIACLAVIQVFYIVSRSTRNIAWGLVATYGLLWLIAYHHHTWVLVLFYIAAAGSLVYTAKYLRIPKQLIVPVLLMGIIAAVTVLFVTRSYTSFDMMQRLQTGRVYQDTLFHASIAAMIKNYGIASTGLHGLVPISYYVLSHTLYAAISALSTVSVIETYGVASWILFGPLLIFSIVGCCLALDKLGKINTPIGWGVTCLLLVAIPFALRRWFSLSDSFFVSESYLISLGLFLAALPLLFKEKLTLKDITLIILLAVFISNTKASVGAIYAGLWMTRFVAIRGTNRAVSLATAIFVSIATVIVILKQVVAGSGFIHIQPLDFIRYSLYGHYTLPYLAHSGNYSFDQLRTWGLVALAIIVAVGFFIFHFLATWVLLAHTAIKRGKHTLYESPAVIYAFAAFLAGALVIAVFQFPGGNAYYFSSVALFVAVPFIIASLCISHKISKLNQPLLLAVLLILITTLRVTASPGKFHLTKHTGTKKNELVSSLITIRKNTPVASLFVANQHARLQNPITLCTAKPFLFPAVSERPWTDVITFNSSCQYRYYGYPEYGITKNQQSITVSPKIPPGMSIVKWTPVPSTISP